MNWEEILEKRILIGGNLYYHDSDGNRQSLIEDAGIQGGIVQVRLRWTALQVLHPETRLCLRWELEGINRSLSFPAARVHPRPFLLIEGAIECEVERRLVVLHPAGSPTLLDPRKILGLHE